MSGEFKNHMRMSERTFLTKRASSGEWAIGRGPPSGGTVRKPLFPIGDTTNLKRGPAGKV